MSCCDYELTEEVRKKTILQKAFGFFELERWYQCKNKDCASIQIEHELINSKGTVLRKW